MQEYELLVTPHTGCPLGRHCWGAIGTDRGDKGEALFPNELSHLVRQYHRVIVPHGFERPPAASGQRCILACRSSCGTAKRGPDGSLEQLQIANLISLSLIGCAYARL